MSQRLVAIIVLVVAGILLFMATNASHSFSDQVSNVFTGHFTERTTWLFAGGIAAAMLGIFMLLRPAHTRHVLK